MATTSPARIDDDLYASAKLVGEVQSRSASQQVAHWARIGREIEASAAISHKEIAEVLEGCRSYDALGAKDQAIVRAEWAARMGALRSELNLAQQFAASGRTWVELDDDGNVVTRVAATDGGAVSDKVQKKRSPKRAAAVSRKVPKAAAGGKVMPNKISTGKAAANASKRSGKAAGVRATR
jgi:ParD-like antitoxin of type II bacterial toxin-antitoxin system